MGANVFPTAEQLALREVFSSFIPLLPASLLAVPKIPVTKSHRKRQKAQGRRERVLVANEILRSLNSLDCGLCSCKERTRQRYQPNRERNTSEIEALAKLHARALQLAASAASERRKVLELSGAHITAELIKAESIER